MRKIIYLFLILVVIASAFSMCVLSVNATTGKVGECTWQLDGTKLTISGEGSMGDDFSAPWGKEIRELVVEEGVTDIPRLMFDGCVKLRSISFPSSLKTIGEAAFRGCSSLASVEIPEGIVSIGDYAFDGCSLVYKVIISKTVTSIGKDSFSECYNLAHIVVDANNPSFKTVNGILFDKNMTELIKYPPNKAGSTYTVPDSVKKIGYKAFEKPYHLYFVNLPDDLTSIGAGAFTYTYMRYLPENQYEGGFYLGDYLILHNDTSAESFSVREGTKLIADAAFSGSMELKNIYIPDGVRYIGEYCFSWCEKLSEIYMPDSIIKVEKNAFDNCTSLKDIHYSGSKDDRSNIQIDLYNSSLTSVEWIYNSLGKLRKLIPEL